MVCGTDNILRVVGVGWLCYLSTIKPHAPLHPPLLITRKCYIECNVALIYHGNIWCLTSLSIVYPSTNFDCLVLEFSAKHVHSCCALFEKKSWMHCHSLSCEHLPVASLWQQCPTITSINLYLDCITFLNIKMAHIETISIARKTEQPPRGDPQTEGTQEMMLIQGLTF